MRLLCLLLLIHLILGGNTQATTYVLPTWEEAAMKSDLIGVVECITAGSVLSRYRVVDSWKGPVPGSEFNVRGATVLVGQRLLVFASKYVPHEGTSMSVARHMPLWWRQIPSDLECTFAIPIHNHTRFEFRDYMGNPSGSLDGFKNQVSHFLHADDQTREVYLMLATARKHLVLSDPGNPGDRDNPEDAALYDHLKTADTVQELCERVTLQSQQIILPVRPGADDPKQMLPPPFSRDREEAMTIRRKYALLAMLHHGREQCLAWLERTDINTLPWEKRDVYYLIPRLRAALSPTKESPSLSNNGNVSQEREPTAKELDQAKAALTKPWSYEAQTMFVPLCCYTPEAVATFLQNWEPKGEEWHDQFGHVLGSAFGHWCGKDRITHLTALCKAKDDWIKAAAAVYLCFDDVNAGTEALHKMMKLDGDPGLWAAVVSASRGEKAAVIKAIDLIAVPRDDDRSATLHNNLKDRLRALLSNSAAQSGAPQPPGPSKEYAEDKEHYTIQVQFAGALKTWWRTHEDRIVLHDPWLETLEKQKVD